MLRGGAGGGGGDHTFLIQVNTPPNILCKPPKISAVRPAAAASRRTSTPSPRWQVHRCYWPRAPPQCLPTRSSQSAIFVPQLHRHVERELPTDPYFQVGPIFKGVAATVGGAVDCRGHPVAPAAIIRCCLLYHRGHGEADLTEVAASCRSATTPRWAGTSAATGRLLSSAGWPTGRARPGTSTPTLGRARSASAPRPTPWARAACFIPSRFPLAGAT